jgi:hypothetical protein
VTLSADSTVPPFIVLVVVVVLGPNSFETYPVKAGQTRANPVNNRVWIAC